MILCIVLSETVLFGMTKAVLTLKLLKYAEVIALIYIYGKCTKNSKAFLFLFSNKMLVIRAGNHKTLVRIANRRDPDQTASEEAV